LLAGYMGASAMRRCPPLPAAPQLLWWVAGLQVGVLALAACWRSEDTAQGGGCAGSAPAWALGQEAGLLLQPVLNLAAEICQQGGQVAADMMAGEIMQMSVH